MKTYDQLINKLIYILFQTKLDISFTIRQLSKKNFWLKSESYRDTKIVVQYLKDTIHLRLIYGSYEENKREIGAPVGFFIYILIRYMDNNYMKYWKEEKL